ncbi:hypothetical protein HYC85_032274 [Camellia sinensis]|uniref:Protein kinase domain-containing protein n=1 Tax=Camellia sinensis TaxID=4442 RepID=A0A7J7FTR0_CAMSI|nr:hypothetical protein HYC85_032274 [Camellia sinensis]
MNVTEREGRESVIVVLVGTRVSTEKSGVAALRCALRDVVKFQVKIATGFEPQALVVEEANNIDATWIVMDRFFSRDQTFPLNGTHCNVALVSGDDDIITHKNLPLHGAETSVVQELNPNPKASKPDKGLVLQEKSNTNYPLPVSQIEYRHYFPSLASMITEVESSSNKSISPRKVELPGKGSVSDDDNISSSGFSKVNLVVRMPLQLSWAEVEEITGGFTRMTCVDENDSCKSYCGYLSDHHCRVLVKRFTRQFDYNVEAEKKAALTLHHKNIQGLIGYHKSESATVVVYPFTRRWILDRFIHGSKGKQVKLTFQEKIKIAIGIGQGIRYMHEGCPRGPIVHGDLRPCNIFLNFDLEPLIFGFGKSTWLQLKQALPISSNRLWHKDPSDPESLALVKSDIFHFGILLLRLFCRRSAPKDDKKFFDWVRPLLVKGAYHELLDEGMEYLDMYGIYMVMCVAAQCIKTNPVSRPSISEVISLLQGETSCAVELSPLSDFSPNMDLSSKKNKGLAPHCCLGPK